MESKAHYKKCLEKGINPQTPIDDDVNSEEDRTAITSNDHNLSQTNDDCDTISDDYSDGDGDGDDLEIDMESSGKIDIFILIELEFIIEFLLLLSSFSSHVWF